MPKCSRIASVVAQQVKHGDYRLRRFPSVNQLAKQLKINPRTATKAVNELIDMGVLARETNGRLRIRKDTHIRGLQIAFLEPAFPSPAYAEWHNTLQDMTATRGWRIKPVGFTHWHDPVIRDVLKGFDGIFFMPPAEDIPPEIIDLIKQTPKPIIVLDQDVSEHDIPCFSPQNFDAIAMLLDPLKKAGHQRVACLNAQPADQIIRIRIDRWHLWGRVHKIEGALIDDHTSPAQSSIERAYAVLTRHLKSNGLSETAIFCTTGAAAVGAMRALSDHGLEPGRDVAICAADTEGGLAKYLRPSLTCLAPPGNVPYLDVCLDWIAGGGKQWVGPYMIRPTQMQLIVGESTAMYRKP